VEERFVLSENTKLSLKLQFAENIKVSTWDKNEIYIKANVLINNGKLDEAFVWKVQKSNESVSILSDFDKELLKKGKRVDCPQNQNRFVNDKENEDFGVCSDINFEIFVPTQTDLNLETISGDIELNGEFTNHLSVKSISGFVDMSWAGSLGANLEMKTITGEVYSDFEIAFENKQEFTNVGYLLKGKLNGGGKQLHLESISGDVFLRKNK
jgi:Putative adhesin